MSQLVLSSSKPSVHQSLLELGTQALGIDDLHALQEAHK